MPFDRLIKAVDQWARQSSRTDVFAQTGPSDIKPRHIRWTRELTPEDFQRHVIEAQAIVAHAGMGTILTALEWCKPILVMPRRGDLRETRNDHQVATARQFEKQGRLAVAYDTTELPAKLDDLTHLKPAAQIENHASSELLGRLRHFVNTIP